MRLTRFSVTGYKNLRVPIVLDELAGVNVIHGENNVGKSNLLQAIDLLFWLLRRFAHKPPSDVRSADDPSNLAFDVDRDALVARGFGTDDIFNFDQPLPIVLEAVVKIDDEDWNRIGRSTDRPAQVSVALVVKPSREGDTRVSVTFDDHQPRAQPSRLTEEEDADVGGLPTLQEQQTDLRRTVPSHLLLRLYDAKESVEPGVFQRWEAFERAMNSLGPIVGDGRFVITYNRTQGRALLAVQKGRTRTPIESMGSGVQQIASLLARVLLANSAIVAVEEPELNLRYELQLRLRDMFREIVESGLGPTQVILTSHSPAFETSETFYAMRLTDMGPTVERRPAQEAVEFLQLPLGVQMPAEHGAYGYVSSDGLLQLSDDIRATLGVEHGGGVVTLKRHDHPYVEVLTNEQFMSLMHGGSEG
jgi:hypothetical protein